MRNKKKVALWPVLPRSLASYPTSFLLQHAAAAGDSHRQKALATSRLRGSSRDKLEHSTTALCKTGTPGAQTASAGMLLDPQDVASALHWDVQQAV